MSDTNQDRTLVVLRHAKASAHTYPDHDRDLADRGHADAAAVGQWFVANDLRFELVICSTSVRTRETWDDVARAGVESDRVAYDDRVYDADVDDLIEVLAEIPDDVASVLVIGHAPGIPALVHELADPDRSDPDALTTLAEKFPTSALAVLTFVGSWADLAGGQAVLTDVAAPRG